ncbi:MAG: hypothetical protein MJZ50_08195 [Treponema sp.]|nr:hypothetical protein [Treponema sp.]
MKVIFECKKTVSRFSRLLGVAFLIAAFSGCWMESVDDDVIHENSLMEQGIMPAHVDSSAPCGTTVSVIEDDGTGSSTLRTILPNNFGASSSASYAAKATLNGNTVDVTSAASTFTMNLYMTGVWSLEVQGFDASGNVIYEGFGTVEVGPAPLYEGSVSMYIYPPMRNTGKIDFYLGVPADGSRYNISFVMTNVATGTVYRHDIDDSTDAASGMTLRTVVSKQYYIKYIQDMKIPGDPMVYNDFPSGEYDLVVDIKNESIPGNGDFGTVARLTDKVYIFDGLTSNTHKYNISQDASFLFYPDSSFSNANPVSLTIKDSDGNSIDYYRTLPSLDVSRVFNYYPSGAESKSLTLVATLGYGQSINAGAGAQIVSSREVSGNIEVTIRRNDVYSDWAVIVQSANGLQSSINTLYLGPAYFGTGAAPYSNLSSALNSIKLSGDGANVLTTDSLAFYLSGSDSSNVTMDSQFAGKNVYIYPKNNNGLDEFSGELKISGSNMKLFYGNSTDMYFDGTITADNSASELFLGTLTLGSSAFVNIKTGSSGHLTGRIDSKATSSSPSFVVDSGAFLYLDSGFNSDFSLGCKPLALSLVADKDVADPGKLMVSSALPSSLGGKVSIALKTADGSAATISDNVGTTVLHAASPYLLTQADCDFFSFSGTGGGNYFIALSSDRKTGVIRDRRATFVITQFPSQKVRLYDGASEVTDFSNMAKDKTYTLRAVVGGVENQDVTVNYHVYQGGTAGPDGSGTINFGTLGLPPDKYTLYMTYTYNGTTYSENMNFTLK